MEVVINGLKINYIMEGSGKDILLLHGWGGRWESWYPIIQNLKSKYRITAPDLPGFGESEAFPNPIGLLGFAELIACFIKQIKINRPVVIGHSFGGSITAELAINYPDLVEKIILADASGIRKTDIKKGLFSLLSKAGNAVFSMPLLNNYKEEIRSAFYTKLGVNDYLTAGKMKNFFKIVVNEDITQVLPKILLPTLLIWGEDDNSTPLWQGKLFNSSIAGSKLLIIPHSGHFAYLEYPELFCEEVERFINMDSHES